MSKAKKLLEYLSTAYHYNVAEKEVKNYLTSYCNQYHDVITGKPIDHECIVIPPNALKAEMEGDTDKAIELIDQSKKNKKWLK